MLSCIGMIVHAHEMITDTLLFAGFAIAILGLVVAMERPVLGGVLLGAGVGIDESIASSTSKDNLDWVISAALDAR